MMIKRLLKSPWTGVVFAVAFVFWDAFWLIGPPIGLEDKDWKKYSSWGLFAIVMCIAQALFVLVKENLALKDPRMTFVVSHTTTVQRDPTLHATYKRIGIRNSSRVVATDCRLTIEDWTFDAPDLSPDTALVVKDCHPTSRQTDINRDDTQQFDLFITRLQWGGKFPEEILVGAPNFPRIQPPSAANVLYQNSESELTLRLTGSDFHARRWRVSLVLKDRDVFISKIRLLRSDKED